MYNGKVRPGVKVWVGGWLKKIPCGLLPTTTWRQALVAGRKLALPGCMAAIQTVPAPRMVAVLPLMESTLVSLE